jgi:2,3-diketo-5-methylthio-1-phosphopentane phosphatase
VPDPWPGLPLAVLVDYDGTVSLRDVGDELMRRFVVDQAEIARMDARYHVGDIGSRDLMRWDMDMLPDDQDLLRAAAAEVPHDEGLVDLAGWCRDHGVVLEVVSDGLGFYIASNLARLGLADLPVFTNENRVRGGGSGMSFPHGHPTCEVCGTCKRERVRVHQASGRLVVFVGDGPSDRYAAWHADVTFAKHSLRAWCEAAGLATLSWERLRDVVAWLGDGVTSGALPTDVVSLGRWRARRGPRSPAFICGPETATSVATDGSSGAGRSWMAGAVDAPR